MTTLRDQGNGEWFKTLFVSEAKAGKTSNLVASCLGALPHQAKGLVTSPQHLHVFAIDTAAVAGLGHFITKACGKPDAYLDVDVIDLSGDVLRVMTSEHDYDYSFYNTLIVKVKDLRSRMAKVPGVHAIVVSSLTGLVEAIQRGLSGPPQLKKGGGMDQSKWMDERRQLVELRTFLQADGHHCFWEGHIMVIGKSEGVVETIGIPGQTGKNWGFNCGQVYRMRREVGSKYPNSQVEKQAIETQPRLEFTSGGRGASALEAKEYDLVTVAEKLGLRVGGFK